MKKIIGFAVVLAMLFAMLPFTVFAADTYYVAGEAALCGSNWNEKDAKNIMTLDGDLYKKVYTNVPAGKYQFKVTDGTWNNCWGNNGQNYSFTLDAKCDVTITFNAATKQINVIASGMGEDKFDPSSITAVGAGSGNFLYGANWDVAAADNHMINNGGEWSITYTDVDAGTYEFKFAADNSWSDNWGTAGEVAVGEWVDIYYNADNSKVTVAENGSTVELLLDLSGFDYASKNGAKVKVVVTAPAAEGGVVVDEGSASLKSDSNGDTKVVEFVPTADGVLTVAMGASTPGWSFFVVNPDETTTLPYSGVAAESFEFPVSAGLTYKVEMSAYDSDLFCAADGQISYKILFTEGAGGAVSKETFIISDTILVEGDNSVSMEANAENTLFEFTPERIGSYTITAPFGVEIGNWGTFFYTVDNTPNKTNTLVWECKSVGQSVLVGVAGSEDVVLTVTRTGDVDVPVAIEYVDYVNSHTPNASNQLVLGAGESVQYVDITKPQTAVLGADGFYHLGSANGPVLYLDMITDAVDMSLYYYGGTPANTLRGQLKDDQGNVIASYNFIKSLRAYVDATDDEGLYPLTEDLAIFLKSYGVSNGWFTPNFSSFEAVKNGCDLNSAWLVACCYVGNGAEEEQPLSDYFVAGSAGLCGSEWDPADENNRMTDNGDGTYTIIFKNVAVGSYEFKITKGSWAENWGIGGADGANFQLTLETAGDVVITFDPASESLVKIDAGPKPLSDFIVAGSAGLCGSEWDPADENNKMFDNGDGTYTIIFKNVAVGSYEFKITKGSWAENWGIGGVDGGNVTVNVDAVRDVEITFNPNTQVIMVDGDVVTGTPPMGDTSLSGVVIVMILAAMSVVALVVCKKKFF